MRGQGLGSALVDRLATICRQEHLRGIAVETQNRNYGAVRFYLRRGFRITGFDDHLYSDDDLARQDVALFLFLEVG
jgi:ribosomal protein S18 acetylase RimI-like enzyme